LLENYAGLKIGIYDTEHFETAYTLLMLFHTSDHDITLFVTKDVAANLQATMPAEQAAGYRWIILEKAALTQTVTLYRYCKKHGVGLLLFNTIAYHHLLFGLLCYLLHNTRTLLCIHDANSFFRPRLSFHARDILRYAGKKILAAAVDSYSTLLSTTQRYIDQVYMPSQPVLVIPGGFFDERKAGVAPAGPAIVVAVPGSVDVQRRDYTELLTALSILKQKNTSIEFVLLGTAREEEAKNVLRSLLCYATEHLRISVYDAPFVDQHEYDRQLKRCDFVYAPLQRTFKGDSRKPEIYGLTKSSGCFFDAVRFGKPLLLPGNIHLPDELVPLSIVHHSAEELASFLTALKETEKMAYREAAIHNAKRFDLSHLQKQAPLLIWAPVGS
jgi:hypothetical protein